MASFDITAATTALTTAEKLRQDTQMIMRPYANWEEYLTPAPMSITVLGELVFISSKDDFSINRNPPKDGFKFIKYPESFRATLMQLCNAGWSAFNEAHKNMDQIRLHTSNMPGYIRTAVEVILKNDDVLLKAILPNTLAEIDNITNECLRLSSSTETRFEMVISLVQEVLEASTNAKEAYGQDLKFVKQQIEENEIRKLAKQETDKRAAEDMMKFKVAIDKAEQLFEKATKSMPSGWEMIGMNLAEGLSESVNTLVSGLANVAILKVSALGGGVGVGAGLLGGVLGEAVSGNLGRGLLGGVLGEARGGGNLVAGGRASNLDKYYDIKDAYVHAGPMVKMIETLKQLTAGNPVDWKDLYDQKSQRVKSDFPKEMLQEIKNTIASLNDSDSKARALSICNDGISICEKLANVAPKGVCEESEEKRLVGNIANVLEKAQAFNATGRAFTKTPPLSQSPPGLAQAQGKGKRAADLAAENARIKIEETRKALDTATTMYNKSVERYEQNKNELTEILITLKKCNVKEIDFKTTLEILAKGLGALGKVKEQWEKMVRFFQMIATIIKASMHTASKTFVSTAQHSSQYSSSSFIKDMAYKQAFHISNIANLVHMISSTYTEISDKYIMERVSSLGRLMGLDQSREFDLERLKLQEGCEEAQREIIALVKKHKNDFNLKSEERIAQLEGLRALLPPPTKEEEQRVKRITQAPAMDDEISQYI